MHSDENKDAYWISLQFFHVLQYVRSEIYRNDQVIKIPIEKY